MRSSRLEKIWLNTDYDLDELSPDFAHIDVEKYNK